jgi:branched-chain amino acid transport system substrate-binding protein
MKFVSRFLIAVAFLSVLSPVRGVCQDSAGAKSEPVRIGAYAALTGNMGSFGRAMKRGIDLAVTEINASGGVLRGRPVEVLFEDDKSRADNVESAISKLVEERGAVALLGEVASSLTLVGAIACEKLGVAQVSVGATNPKVTQMRDASAGKAPGFTFRACFIDPVQGDAMAIFAAESLKAKTAVILEDTKSDYSVALAEQFAKAFVTTGGKVLATQEYSQGDVDFKVQLRAVKRLKPQVVYLPGYYQEAGVIARQARELGISVPILGGDGWGSYDILSSLGGAALKNTFVTEHYTLDAPTPGNPAFIASFRAAYGEDPDAVAALAYDATKMLAAAIDRAGTASSAEIRDALATTTSFEGVTGSISIGGDGETKKSVHILELRPNGKRLDRVLVTSVFAP